MLKRCHFMVQVLTCWRWRMLTALHKSLDLIGARRGHVMEVQDIPPEDFDTYNIVYKADTIGVVQVESRAQLSMLPRLKRHMRARKCSASRGFQ